MPERRVSRPLEAERERQLIRWALAEGWQVRVTEGSAYVVLIDPPAGASLSAPPYDQDAAE